MTPQEERYFEMLVEDREENSKVLEKPSMRGVKRGVVEKYSDQAHFIYELLQNADDVGATRADFILLDDKLLFKHNGIRKFSISDPDNEDADTKLGTLGDINAITSIANSNKTEATIGKFGVGFKAVFQYTNSPAIFEDNVAFRIKNFIVPERLYFDYEERKTGETLFEFPFDKEDCSLEKAFEDISNKLLKLNCPTLFLSNLEEVTFKFGSENGVYKKEQINRRNLEDISAKFLRLIQPNTESQKLWLFSRKSNGRNYCVGFFLDDKGCLKPVDKPAFCFFPTKRVTKLKFIIHAPFLLTDSREGILAGNEHNIKMIRLIAELVADSLLCLRKLRLVDDGILKIIPVRENDFSDSDEISFKPIFNIVKEKMLTAKILPTRDGYTTAENAYWADALHLLDIFSDNRLGELIYNPNAKWIFTTVNRNNADSDVKNYFSDIKSFTEDRILDKIDENFIENQSVEWLHKFYKWLSERRSQKRILDAKSKPFFLDTNHKATAAFDLDGKPQIFLPTVNNLGNYRTICSELLQNPETETFLRETIGIEEPTLKDMINNKILPLYENHSVTDDTEYFKILFRYYNAKCTIKEISTYLLELKKVIYLRNLNRTFSSPSELYMPETNFIKPFVADKPQCLIDMDFYLNLVGDEDELKKFFFKILLPLYKQRPKKFIIAGDPFQIEPVTVIDLWQKENIYTLVALNSFAEPKTIPHNYPVETLTTQYRSVPAIGKIFSELAYKGILNHARKDSDQRSLKIDNWFDVKTLNIIKFPVKKYESIYRPKRLNGTSSYHIYSALFTFEFIKKLNTWIGKNTDENFSIGIVAPYRAQADLLEKLFASAKQSEQINKCIDIQIGTVHTFQGDECDILFAVFNTPPTISASPKMFLNRLNIINVAISRAKDYLFLVMPDDNTENIENLRLVKEVERLFANNMINSGEFATQDIEKSIFGNPNYIEENSFATGHQSVNVYARPERKYEIRSEDNAVDVQVHEKQPEN